MSNSPGLVDFAIWLVNSVFTLPDRQVMFFEEFELQKNCEINWLGLVEMMSGLVNASFSLPEWQAVKMIFFAPCMASVLQCSTNWAIKTHTLRALHSVSFLSRVMMNSTNWPAAKEWVFIAHLVERCRPWVRMPLKPRIFFFFFLGGGGGRLIWNCLNYNYHYDDHVFI